MTNTSSKRGFTLVELAIYFGITMTILLVLTELLSAIFNTQLSTKATTSVAQDGRYIYTRLTYDINRAQTVSTPLNLGDSSQTLQVTINGIGYTYSLSNGDLIITDQQGTYVLNSADTTISNLSFKRIGNVNGKHTFRMNYTVTSKIIDEATPETKVFQTTAGLR